MTPGSGTPRDGTGGEPLFEGDLPCEDTFWRTRWRGAEEVTFLLCARCGVELGVEGRATPHTLRDCFDKLASDVQDLLWWKDSVQEANR